MKTIKTISIALVYALTACAVTPDDDLVTAASIPGEPTTADLESAHELDPGAPSAGGAVAAANNGIYFLGFPDEYVCEQGYVTGWVRLGANPGATVTVSMASADPASLGIYPATLQFTTSNWSTYQLVGAWGYAETWSPVTITASAPGYTPKYDGITVMGFSSCY